MSDTIPTPAYRPRIIYTPPMTRAALDALLAAPHEHTVDGKRIQEIVSDRTRAVFEADGGLVYGLFFATLEDEDASEREWDALVSTPHVRDGLRRLAAEARREYGAGETEEGL